MNKVDRLISIDQIGELANESLKLNKKGKLDVIDHTKYKDVIREILADKVFETKDIPENVALVAEPYNANLFFHPWLFTVHETADPLIGLFHPRGGIKCTIQSSVGCNQLSVIGQNFHGPDTIYLSSDVARFKIDFSTPGIAVGVCYDFRRKICRVELIITLNDIKKKLLNIEHIINEINCRDLFDTLIQIPEIYNLINIPAYNLIKLCENEIRIPQIKSEFGGMYNGVVIFFYNQNTRYHNNLHINVINVDKNTIPYIDEINAELVRNSVVLNSITYEFGIKIINSIFYDDLSLFV
jgi:hypothetical protein